MELHSLALSLNAGTPKMREQIKSTQLAHGGNKGLVSGPPLGMKIWGCSSWAWWPMPVIPELGRLKQEDCKGVSVVWDTQ